MSLSALIRSRLILRIAGIVLGLAGLLALPGCWVTSINPLYEEASADRPYEDPDLVFDQSLIGSWTRVSDDCTAPLTITSKNEIYDLQSTGKGEGCTDSDKPSHYQARLVKLDTHYFLDFSPMEDDVCDLCLAKHDIFLVKLDKATFSLTPIDSDWLKKSIAAKTVTLATLADDTDTITASSKDLKAFCRKYAENKEVFQPESTSTLKRK
jgi:hypothetical protein